MDGRSDILFDAVLKPNPPLGPKTLRAILIVVGLFNLVFAASFVARGAWPIAPFMGADVAGLAWAFHASAKAARREERLTLTPSLLRIERRPEMAETTLNPYWVRVETPARGLALWSYGKSVQIGAFLGVSECAALARSLREALWRLRQP